MTCGARSSTVARMLAQKLTPLPNGVQHRRARCRHAVRWVERAGRLIVRTGRRWCWAWQSPHRWSISAEARSKVATDLGVGGVEAITVGRARSTFAWRRRVTSATRSVDQRGHAVVGCRKIVPRSAWRSATGCGRGSASHEPPRSRQEDGAAPAFSISASAWAWDRRSVSFGDLGSGPGPGPGPDPVPCAPPPPSGAGQDSSRGRDARVTPMPRTAAAARLASRRCRAGPSSYDPRGAGAVSNSRQMPHGIHLLAASLSLPYVQRPVSWTSSSCTSRPRRQPACRRLQ